MRRAADVVVEAFPTALRTDAREVARLIPRHWHQPMNPFSVVVDGEPVSIPYRVYNDHPGNVVFEVLTEDQHTMLHCFYSRHHDGRVRQAHVEQVLSLDHTWVVPFVVRLLGEYVVEIAEVIHDALASRTNLTPYRYFAAENPEFVRRTAAQATSYWNCYYRGYAPPNEQEIERLVRLNPDYRYRRFEAATNYPALAALALFVP